MASQAFIGSTPPCGGVWASVGSIAPPEPVLLLVAPVLVALVLPVLLVALVLAPPPLPVPVSSPHATRAAGIMARTAALPNQLINFMDFPASEERHTVLTSRLQPITRGHG